MRRPLFAPEHLEPKCNATRRSLAVRGSTQRCQEGSDSPIVRFEGTLRRHRRATRSREDATRDRSEGAKKSRMPRRTNESRKANAASPASNPTVISLTQRQSDSEGNPSCSTGNSRSASLHLGPRIRPHVGQKRREARRQRQQLRRQQCARNVIGSAESVGLEKNLPKLGVIFFDPLASRFWMLREKRLHRLLDRDQLSLQTPGSLVRRRRGCPVAQQARAQRRSLRATTRPTHARSISASELVRSSLTRSDAETASTITRKHVSGARSRT